MKKIISIIVLITLIFPVVSLADEEDEEIFETSEIQGDIEEASANSSNEPKLNSRAAVVIDRNTKTVLFGKNENEKRAMASTTKIMTAIITLEKGNLEDVIEVSRKSSRNWWFKTRIKKGRQNYFK